MKKITFLLILLSPVMLQLVYAELPLGEYDSLTMSPVTGDMGGFDITIKSAGKGYTGSFQQFAGGPLDRQILKDITCRKPDTCTFTCRGIGPAEKCVLTRIPDGAVLTLPVSQKSFLLHRKGKPAKLPPSDTFHWAMGKIYSSGTVKSPVMAVIQGFEKVKLIQYHTDPEYMVEIEVRGKRGFAEYANFGDTSPAAILGDGVRLRKTPSLDGEILAKFPRWTIVGYMFRTGDEKWVMVSHGGRTGYVAREYITGY